MPRPVNKKAAYFPGLDGLRTIAVALVVAYHLGVPFMGGGLLGVGVFFTLSGFLITSLLLSRWDRHGDLDLKHFWIRRFRRLLPAVVLLLIAVLVATAFVEPDKLGTRVPEALAALFYVANWHTIAVGKSYFEQTEGAAPLDHLWSLAVEEQFYIVWPLVLLGLFLLTRRMKPSTRRGTMAALTFVLGAVSFVLLALLADPAGDSTRAYEGTDTRAGGLLWGAVLAMLWRPAAIARLRGAAVRVLDVVGLLGLVGIFALVATTDQQTGSLYTWGIAALTVATCATLVPLVHADSWLAKVLGLPPLQWVGARSYGVYLWHMPVVAFLPDRVMFGQPVLRGLLVVVLTLILAALSWRFVEDPIRRHGFLALVSGRAARTDRQGDGLPAAGAGTAAAAGAAPAAAGAAPAAARPAPRHADPGTPALGAGSVAAAASPAAGLSEPAGAAGGSSTAPEPAGAAGGSSTAPERAAAASPGPLGLGLRAVGVAALSAAVLAGLTALPQTSVQEIARDAGAGAAASEAPDAARPTATTTSCPTVVHIGDSTSLALGNTSRSKIEDPALRLTGQYQSVGVETVVEDILGGRSSLEHLDPADLEGLPNTNTPEAVASHVDEIGEDGCWVVAIGLNDAANMDVADSFDRASERIDAVMQVAEGRRVLWVDAVIMPWSTLEHYTPENVEKFNTALKEATTRYPNLWVYDYQAEAQGHPEWFLEDDANHNNAAGAVEKAHRIAQALVAAFPEGSEPSEKRVVLSQ